MSMTMVAQTRASAMLASTPNISNRIPTYWTFWEYIRLITLAPIEIANAFLAPVLEADNLAATARTPDELLKEIGHRRVIYGEMEKHRGCLAVDEIGKVERFNTI
jgi:hypothetical protein